jgi:UDPglucose 6-dehydrogenase
MRRFEVSVVGLGRVGAPMAACFASKGHRVIGVDVNEAAVRLTNEGVPCVAEPGLDRLLSDHGKLVSATGECEAAVIRSDITFVIVPTPTDPETGGFFNGSVLKAAARIGAALGRKESYHLVAVTSTVLPGSMENQVIPVLEERSGKVCGRDFGVCYNPLFIALGSVVSDILRPDFVLIGESDTRSGDSLEAFYDTICDNDPPKARMNLVSAELTKISLNAFVTTKISYANMLAEICERLPGSDARAVTEALGLDTRIGGKYLQAATGYGGPCFPRDNKAFASVANALGVDAAIARATETINQRQYARLIDLLMSTLGQRTVVGILGLAYKTGTSEIDESPGMALAADLAGRGIDLVLYDPLALDNARIHLGDKAAFADSPKECAQKADALVITLPCPEFRVLEPQDLARSNGERAVLIDCWRILPSDRFSEVCTYIAIGLGPDGNVRGDLSDRTARRPEHGAMPGPKSKTVAQ